ncbi:MAG TPA: Gfo/Idh/MocA family oxidoreductase [Spirochaetia bacterium]|nr:Gfo/Idh/MocA family oxidoreductase [Spirochaetales bacterium]HRY81924.1 Gfo/Idh/MocA family oxidoreductase [Spirochaetia bacterium]HRZ90053.1 Gfo/Idh/MocA family oxidoreductase [Spirochaetia bacterium]
MSERAIGIVMNGVTGRMGTNQHLVRSLLAVRAQGGLRARDGSVIVPEPVLVGRDERKLKALAAEHGLRAWTTDLDAALSDKANQVYFDSQVTSLRPAAILKAIAAGKAIYTEKPTATTLDEALGLCRAAKAAGIKNGVVQDKLWLPGLRKLKYLIDTGFFGRILSVRGEFGYWVFDGFSQPAQRPSWNYRAEEGGGIILDMFCHWQYVISNLFGTIRSVSALGATHLPKRVDEKGMPYDCTAEDSAYGTFELEGGVVCQFNSSWDVRVRRDDLFTMQVDGTRGSAVAGLRECRIQGEAMTPKPVWNPDLDSPIDYFADWAKVPTRQTFDNAFKAQWELFLLHLVQDDPFPWTLETGARGVQLAELALRSWKERRWIDIPDLGL